MRALFSPGRLVVTPAALEALQPAEVHVLLARHVAGDWGDVDAHDKGINNDNLKHGGRLFSVYVIEDYQMVWVITEADWSVTTILLPEDY